MKKAPAARAEWSGMCQHLHDTAEMTMCSGCGGLEMKMRAQLGVVETECCQYRIAGRCFVL